MSDVHKCPGCLCLAVIICNSVIICTAIDDYACFSAVVLSGSSSDADFRGFLVQGRVVADGNTMGTFTDNGDDQQVVCSGVSGKITTAILIYLHVHIRAEKYTEYIWVCLLIFVQMCSFSQ